ncbi:MAG TPA: hypothetical protein VNY73_09850 [Bacteroidia bacterium]|jgi:hypothetical protein|nr:hypothetical protein [Bacteroidia bacterium]
MQLLVNIKDNTKAGILLKFLKSLNYINVEEVEQGKISLTNKEKRILDERRVSMAEEDFIPWEKAKKQLKHKVK